MSESPGAVIAELKAQRDFAVERVQELEAGTMSQREAFGLVIAAHDRMKGRLEKAEAEVERLKMIIRDLMRMAHVSIPEFEGGGRESGPAYAGFVMDGGNRWPKDQQPVNEPRKSRETGPSAAAANPAAPFFCPTCGSDPHEPDCPTARKEAAGRKDGSRPQKESP